METTNEVKADFSKFMQPPITTREEFSRVLCAEENDAFLFDYWDETLCNDWDDDLARPDDYPIKCMISDPITNIHYMFQVTNKALNDHFDWMLNEAMIDLPCKDNSVNEAVLTISEDKDDSDLICFDFDDFMDKVNR